MEVGLDCSVLSPLRIAESGSHIGFIFVKKSNLSKKTSRTISRNGLFNGIQQLFNQQKKETNV
jgi:hypothetical protein